MLAFDGVSAYNLGKGSASLPLHGSSCVSTVVLRVAFAFRICAIASANLWLYVGTTGSREAFAKSSDGSLNKVANDLLSSGLREKRTLMLGSVYAAASRKIDETSL